MAKTKTQYVCSECGAPSPRWAGKCPSCGKWDTLAEEELRRDEARATRSPMAEKGSAIPLPQIGAEGGTRQPSGIEELDRILGGGLVQGSAILVGGDPGIGKSTLLMQTAGALARSIKPILYVTAEESAQQVRLRAERLGCMDENILVLPENNVDRILSAAEKHSPALVIVDSIQMVYWPMLDGAPGSVGQVRESAAGLIAWAKRAGSPIFLIGHVTKDGAIAGPKVLEHMVDVVLYFEGDKHHAARILRGVKNRFGAANEIGVFEMAGEGLLPVRDPSKFFLSGRKQNAQGTAVAAALSGSRPFLIEVQALAAPGYPGSARRRVSGADSNRVAMLLAVLEKRCGLQFHDTDVFVNVVGGVELDDPGSDLALAMAMAGSFADRAPGIGTAMIGEVGLGGEVRPVQAISARLKEAARLGFSQAVIPAENAKEAPPSTISINPVRTLDEAMAFLYPVKAVLAGGGTANG